MSITVAQDKLTKVFKQKLVQLREKMVDQIDSLLAQWQTSNIEEMSKTPLHEFGEKNTSKISKLLVRLMKESTATLNFVDTSCKKLGIVSQVHFTDGKAPKLRMWSQCGLLVFTMGTVQKLIDSKAAMKHSTDSLAKASIPEIPLSLSADRCSVVCLGA